MSKFIINVFKLSVKLIFLGFLSFIKVLICHSP
jgi:hypothetical protein